ncbi:MAG TPA: DUF2239 family protein [Polyangiaceae bacterium]|jgi:hypothetical protein|nr:DUF2239 family protein [Polyangiaceae bacterium]
MNTEPTYTAFAGNKRITAGSLGKMLAETKPRVDDGTSVLIFVDQTGQQIDFDFRGTLEEVLARYAPAVPRPGPGRPKLGVVSREVSLLPRHWEWLETQPQGASASIRRLVEAAMKHEPNKQEARARRDAAGKFMWGIAGNLPGFEEASRALYAKDDPALEALTAEWPADVRDHLLALVRQASRLENAADGG